ncbi:glycoside hydrolase family 12 protein [[Actinomadura] parvosata]|uniref:glycoside hydrolase family 12 protein n=1 Tax=[Actinomadura] parvosata TaxID=1955412 RepID=UPI00406D4695
MIRTARRSLVALAAGLTIILSGLVSAPAQAAVWSSCDQWATWSSSGYTLYNNIWGSGAGAQCVWANSATNWGVWADHPNTGGIKSYPNSTRWSGKRISALGTLTSTFNVTVPTSGVAFTSAYDVWSSDNQHEIMLWMNKYGPVGPLGTFQATATVGGHTWNVYRGSNGHNAVYSFVRTTNTAAGTVDIKAICAWIRNRGWFGDVTIGNVQFGYEITSSAGGKDFVTNNLTITAT